jgi:hypothetical protein
MNSKTILMTLIMTLILGGGVFAQQKGNRSEGFWGMGRSQEQQPQQTFTGVVDKVDGNYVLIVGDRAYRLDIDDEQLIRSMVLGQEVEVRGTMDEETIQAETMNRAGEMQEQPGMQQPMGGTTGQPSGQPMGTQERNQTRSW